MSAFFAGSLAVPAFVPALGLGADQRYGTASYAPETMLKQRDRMVRVIVIGGVALFLGFIGFSAVFDWDEENESGAHPLLDEAAWFAMKVFADYGAGDYGEVWSDLHPAQQRLIDENEFLACYPGERRDYITKIERDEDATLETVQIPGTDLRPTAFITRIGLTIDTGEGVYSEARHLPVARVADRWAWIMPRGALNALQRGRCPRVSVIPGATR